MVARYAFLLRPTMEPLGLPSGVTNPIGRLGGSNGVMSSRSVSKTCFISLRKLIALLEKYNSFLVKSEVIISLRHSQDNSVIKYLLKFSTHKNRKIRAALAVAFSRLGGNALSENALRALKKDKSYYVRYWAS